MPFTGELDGGILMFVANDGNYFYKSWSNLMSADPDAATYLSPGTPVTAFFTRRGRQIMLVQCLSPLGFGWTYLSDLREP